MALTSTGWGELLKILVISALVVGSIFVVVYLMDIFFSAKF
jgi:hypothetical protein